MIRNVNQKEIDKFSDMAKDWWDYNGSFSLIHKLNPLRVDYIVRQCNGIFNKNVLDVGCGAGILSEALVKNEAIVTGIDLSPAAIESAKDHSKENNLSIDYKLVGTDIFAKDHQEYYDLICCLEMLEHVPNPQQIIENIYTMLKPGGKAIISTINRNFKSYLFMIEMAENILSMLPRGTHIFNSFIKPGELINWAEKVGFKADDAKGYHYNPFKNKFWLNDDVSVNYIITFVKK